MLKYVEKMGFNKNISILMLFDCVRVNTGLGFHWICNRERKGGGYMWIDDDINLEPFFSIGRFWLVKTYQYGCHPSVFSHHALGTEVCDESYCNERDHIWSSGMRGIFLPRVILRWERHRDHIWILIFLWRQFRGWGYAPIWHMGGVYPYMGAP
jgi:hypothetical protein